MALLRQSVALIKSEELFRITFTHGGVQSNQISMLEWMSKSFCTNYRRG